MALNTLAACQTFVESQPAAAIASRLREDQHICQTNSGFPSLVVYCLPPTSSAASRDIAQALSFDDAGLNHPGIHVPLAVCKMRLAGVVQGIKSYLASMKRQDTQVDVHGIFGPYESGPIPPHLIPSDEEFYAALKVLRYLQLPFVGYLDSSTPLGDVVAIVEKHLSLGADVRSTQLHASFSVLPPARPVQPTRRGQKKSTNRKCYICLFSLTSAHPLYPSLCVPCGNFNIASSSLSLPPQFNLTSKTALVTGARINLGYHVALRLLRAGCSVIITTRYPHAAEVRYLAESDTAAWKDRLRIVGADFRTAKDVFALVGVVKKCLRDWGTEKLDLLINNAAQTLTDRADVELNNGEREQHLMLQGVGDLVIDVGYKPRLRGGMGTIQDGHPTHGDIDDSPSVDRLETGLGPDRGVLIKPVKSSWTQKLSEIPYEDVISAHSINTFVPLILMRELLPIMSLPAASPPPPSTLMKPAAYVINVSSREGVPESRPSHPAKAGHHVHTNMSKAALNMLTETEAGEAWRSARVAVNSVDPGYMSADPEWMAKLGRSDEQCPIGWEDGAARVLWPVAVGEKGTPVWGRFLKHFQTVDVNR
ncbi:putative short chain dehydrogenase [Lyophyllum shimeji]|uniref:Short chain dehydrogenase n=1 Tax=Lyophyllum shimeji TaxID=47721 RepID=A0A9P3PHY2_LYOSH|nr:putative short chain dehydrogenase [Lyophyllum shimeji]